MVARPEGLWSLILVGGDSMNLSWLVVVLTGVLTQRDLAQLQGTWDLQQLQVSGLELGSSYFGKLPMTIDNSTFVMLDGEISGTLKPIPLTCPKRIEIRYRGRDGRLRFIPSFYSISPTELVISWRSDMAMYP